MPKLKVFVPLVATIIIAITASYATPAPAQAAAAPARATTCATVLERITPGRPEARVATDFCSTDPAAVAAVVPAGSFVLVTFYGERNYSGAYRTIWAPSPCDSAGYHITDNRALNSEVGGIRSVLLGNAGCTFVQVFYDVGMNYARGVQSGYNGLPKLGHPIDTHVWSARMWLQKLPCHAPAAC